MATHRAAYQAIQRELPRYRHASADRDTLGLEQQSANGGDVDAYCAGDTIRVLVASYWGESGNFIERFYLTGDAPFFVLRRREMRDRPFVDAPVTRVEEERLYLSGPRLVRWLGAGNRPEPVNTPAAAKEVASVLADVRELRAAMRGCQPQYAP